MRKRSATPKLPETMEFFITSYFERSGLQFVPADSHMRGPDGQPPESLPSWGHCPSKIRVAQDQTLQIEVGKQTCDVYKGTTIKIRVVAQYTGHPFEWTPKEIYEAMFPGQRRTLAKACIAPVNPHARGYRDLILKGMEDAGKAIPRVIPPMSRLVPRRTERNVGPAAPVPMTAEGMQRAASQGEEAFDSFMPGWNPPSSAAPVAPENLPGAIPIRR